MKRSRWLCAFSGAFAMEMSLRNPALYVFCDEAGDPGLTSTASDWFVVSAIVVAAERESELPRWVAAIKKPMKNMQRPDLHFYLLEPHMKRRACRFLSKLPVRCFTMVSNKANMIDHQNLRCEARYAWRLYNEDGTYVTVPRKTWFHNFVLKAMLERVTEWCEEWCQHQYGRALPIDITIGRRGGFSIADFKTTLEIDRRHYNAGTGTLQKYLTWPVVDLNRIQTAPAAEVSGLQLADVVAGAFWNAVEEHKLGSAATLDYALALRRRMARHPKTRDINYFGVTGLPWSLRKANLSDGQRALFEAFGYDGRKLVRPGPRSTRWSN